MKKSLAILGSTGSIGTSTLSVVEQHPDRFKVASLAAARSVERLARQAARHDPAICAVLDKETAEKLRNLLPAGSRTKVVHGPQGYLEAALAQEADTVVSAMVGSAGLLPTYAAVEAGRTLALANKEVLVAAGELVTRAAKKSGAAILPVDSEHSAIFQALLGQSREAVSALWLTASGGPFRNESAQGLARVTPAKALDHPNWDMGPKITVDSATLMNKGLEVIEAHWLFGQPFSKVKVVIHPQSVVHSLVEYRDGSVIAQLGQPDMRVPIAYALSYPERIELEGPTLDIAHMGPLSFEEPDTGRFPALSLAYAAGRAGGAMPAILNAANEIAVKSFLEGKLDFLGITACARAVLEGANPAPAGTLEEVMSADSWARSTAEAWVKQRR